MRRPELAFCLVAFAAYVSAPATLRAQQPAPARGTAAAPTTAPGTAPALPDPALSMLNARSARSLLRNGEDFITYGEFDRALQLLLEADKRQNELSDRERQALQKAIREAREGMRSPDQSPRVANVRPRRGSARQAGAIALNAPPAAEIARTQAEPARLPLPDAPVQLASATTTTPAATAPPTATPLPAEPAPSAVAATPGLDLPLLPTPSSDTAGETQLALAAPPQRPVETGPVLTSEPLLPTTRPAAPAAVEPPADPAPAAAPPASVEPATPTPDAPEPAPVPVATTPAPTQAAPAPMPAMAAEPAGSELVAEPVRAVPLSAPITDSTTNADPAAPASADAALPELPAPPPPIVSGAAPAPVVEQPPMSDTPPPALAGNAEAPLDRSATPLEPPPAAAPVAAAPEPAPAPAAAPTPVEAAPSPTEVPTAAAAAALPPPAEELASPGPAGAAPVLGGSTEEPALPPLPPTTREPVTFPTVTNAASPRVSDFPEHLQRQVEEIARRQEEERRITRPPSLESSLSSEALAELGQSESRIKLPRPPSPTQPLPIRAIPVPENFVPLEPRNWEPSRKVWAAAATCHGPLYFQDAVLERYGQSVEQAAGPAGRFMTYPLDDPKQSKQRNQLFQPLYSAGLFAFQVAALPYNLVVDPPWEAEYDLGYYRPGDRIPPDTYYLPWKGVGPPLHSRDY